MRHFIVHTTNGKILRTGFCSAKDFSLQAQTGELVMEGTANDLTQKVVNGKVIDKAPEEIEDLTPVEVPESQRPANITNEQWQKVLKRLKKLENKT